MIQSMFERWYDIAALSVLFGSLALVSDQPLLARETLGKYTLTLYNTPDYITEQ